MDPNVSQCLAKPVDNEELLQALYRYTKTEAVKKYPNTKGCNTYQERGPRCWV